MGHGMITADDALALVRDAVALVCEVEPSTFGRDTLLIADLAADSLALVEIVEVCEESLRNLGSTLVFDDEQLDSFLTVGDVADYLIRKQSAMSSQSMVQV